MTEFLSTLAVAPLFTDIEQNDIEKLLHCLQAHYAAYDAGSLIIKEGSMVCEFGVMLIGEARSLKTDGEGKQAVLTHLTAGSEIGVMLAASRAYASPVTVQADSDASVLMIPFAGVFGRCAKACPRHDILLRNYINLVAQKGLVLQERLSCLLKPTVRDKILAYLDRLSQQQQSHRVQSPLSRNAMAEYLNVERSALSRELSRMREDGLIQYRMNRFTLQLDAASTPSNPQKHE